jgi:retinoid hydroxylase
MTTLARDRELPLPPKSPSLPVLGDTLAFLRDGPGLIETRGRQLGPVFRLNLFGQPTAVLLGEEANRFVLHSGTKHFNWKYGWPAHFRDLWVDTIFLEDGDKHRQRRKLLMPAFQTEAIEGYLPQMEKSHLAAIARWEKAGRMVCIEDFGRVTLRVANQLFLGDDTEDGAQDLPQWMKHWLEGFYAVPIRFPLGAFSRALAARRKLISHVEQAIHSRREKKTTDALGLLTGFRDSDGVALTTEQLASEMLVLVAAGFHTTTSMLTYVMFALAEHPDVLAKARQEQRDLGLQGPVTLDQLHRMSYLHAVMAEIERLYAPVPFGFRRVVEPFEFQGYRIPAGWQVAWSVETAQKDPRNYEDPLRFDPERFTQPGSDADRRGDFKLVGFGGGPRMCIGTNFAKVQAKLLMSHVLRGYEWEVEPDQDLRPLFTPERTPKSGLRIRFKRRADAPGTPV